MSLPAQNIKIINNTVLKFQTQRQRLAHLHLSKVNSHTKSNPWNLSMLSQCQPPQLKAHPSCHSYKVTTAQSSCTSTIAKICYYSQLTNCHSISGQSVSPCIISLHTSNPSDSHVTETVSLPNKSKKTLLGQSSKHPLRMYFS